MRHILDCSDRQALVLCTAGVRFVLPQAALLWLLQALFLWQPPRFSRWDLPLRLLKAATDVGPEQQKCQKRCGEKKAELSHACHHCPAAQLESTGEPEGAKGNIPTCS
mmetsp:Transcript_44705/g.106370  ORF Transcript_44705/g.106370 Transcript_44705/m.106370 type:complete len:108 (-) Transcript_44705:21-344(-)